MTCDPYRKSVCRDNKNAESASLLRFGRECERKITREEDISVGVIRMLFQLVVLGPIERLNVKFTKNVYL